MALDSSEFALVGALPWRYVVGHFRGLSGVYSNGLLDVDRITIGYYVLYTVKPRKVRKHY